MTQWLIDMPLYVPLGMALIGLNLLVAYVSLTRRTANYVLGFQGAFMGIVTLLPTGSFTYVWALTCSLVFLIAGTILTLRVRQREQSVGRTASNTL